MSVDGDGDDVFAFASGGGSTGERRLACGGGDGRGGVKVLVADIGFPVCKSVVCRKVMGGSARLKLEGRDAKRTVLRTAFQRLWLSKKKCVPESGDSVRLIR